MDQKEHAMTVFAEECGELAVEFLALQKNVLKALRFGIDEQRDLPTSNRERIESEWQDLLGSMEHMRSRGISIQPDAQAIQAKIQKIERYCAYAETQGTLSPNAKYTDEARYSDYTCFRIAIHGYLLFKYLQPVVIETRNTDSSIRF